MLFRASLSAKLAFKDKRRRPRHRDRCGVVRPLDLQFAAGQHDRHLAIDAAFPQSVNVGFAEVDARDRIRLRVYERGVGETLACGSGACAAAAILMRRGRIDREVVVSLPGGELLIQWPDDAASITMAGPATFVFEGSFAEVEARNSMRVA